VFPALISGQGDPSPYFALTGPGMCALYCADRERHSGVEKRLMRTDHALSDFGVRARLRFSRHSLHCDERRPNVPRATRMAEAAIDARQDLFRALDLRDPRMSCTSLA
jgi:hypothetical protein